MDKSSFFLVLEWVATALGILGALFNCRGRRVSFLIWSVSSAMFVALAIYLDRYGLLTLQTIYIGMNMYGFRNWLGDAPVRKNEGG